jgi:50S ribosomal protein L16 3-hydroxylase
VRSIFCHIIFIKTPIESYEARANGQHLHQHRYNSRMKKISLLGGITAAKFLREYWQKKPLLVRNAVSPFASVLSPQQLFELASLDEVESRLVSKSVNRLVSGSGTHWQMQHGPFSTSMLAKAGPSEWTLLVQGVNLYNQAADQLLRQFRFIPDSRLDDLMISYAVDGGGVGAHVDSYDVFLLQAHGQRRWRISAQNDLSLVDNVPLKILRHFVPQEEYVLNPGDLLYLPPNYAHEGVAIGECMTYSIGFRAPSYQEIGEAFLEFMGESIDLPGRYSDADLKPTIHPAQIDNDMLLQIAQQLENVRFTKDDVTIFLGQFLSEPKSSVILQPLAKPLTAARFTQAMLKRGIRLALKTRMLYRGSHVFINGESFCASSKDRPLLAKLANLRQIDITELVDLPTDLQESFYVWYCDGWLTLN